MMREVNERLEKTVDERTRSLRLFGDIVQSDISPILAFDRDHRVVGFNRAHRDDFLRVMGHEQRIGEDLLALFPPEQAVVLRSLMDRALAGEAFSVVQEFGDLDRVKPTWEIAYTPLRDETGAVIGAFHQARDISARLRVERDLHAVSARLAEQNAARERTWRFTPDLLSIIDLTSGTIERVNPSWSAALGWTAAEMESRPYTEFVHPDDRTASDTAFASVRLGTPILRFENRYRTRDGRWRRLSWVAFPEGDKLYSSSRDVTEAHEQAAALAKVEDALRQSQKMEAVGQLTGRVAHDFNNLLTVIKSSTDMLKRPNLVEERRTRYVAAISDTVDRAAKLTGQSLAFARRQSLKPEVFAACDSVRALSEMIGTLTGSRIAIAAELPEKACFVNADPSQFDTALVNMAANARDAMDGDGRLTVRVSAVQSMPAVRSHAAVEGDFVAVAVSDTGSGIPTEQLDRIFEPFFTTKAVGKGTGLGLSQVFGFAKQSGGEVLVESEVGRGTTFTLYLPRVAAPEIAPDDSEPTPLVDGHGTRVLVVEDNAEVGSFAIQTLNDLGYEPVLANNADEALAELAKDADHFDVMFTDVIMPGMNGIELGQEIRRRYHDLPVLLASGYSHVLAQNGTYGFELLHKPYSGIDPVLIPLANAVLPFRSLIDR